MNKISFVNFHERGLKPITDALSREGQKVAGVKATNMPKREVGFQIKSAMITLESGQKLEIKIKANGSIFQVRLNGKVVPVKNSEDIDEPANLKKAVKEMAGYIQRNEAAYIKQRNRRLARQKVTPTPKATASIDKQLAEAKENWEFVQAEYNEAIDQGVQMKSELNTKRDKLAEIKAEIRQEEERNEALRAEYAQLKEAA